MIKRLPDGQQIILRMKHIDGMETSEIAQMIGSTDGAVRVQL
ncbi:MAG: RNA polymerase subunit sigma-70, partial [Clostridia bacterium]|nr:RNA polymerase subunit sigma-70 [Clostridia bacterium]